MRGRWSAISLFCFSRKKMRGNAMSILESERLILRQPRHADIQAMTVWLGDYAVSRNLARVPHPYSEADAEDFVAKRGRHGNGHYSFTITRREDGLFLGGIGLHLEEAG